MTISELDVVGLGYEGHDLASFLQRVTDDGVDIVADIRLNPISRKAGFSKKALASALAELGVEYVHLRSLGNPRNNRAGFAELHSAGAYDARRQYLGLLDTADAEQALDWLRTESQSSRMGLLCFEADERHCHREVVMNIVRSGPGELDEQ